jgi:polysaccharide export outer membrane protein
VGGLSVAAADPTGVFVLRNEPADIANMVLGRDDLQGAQRMVYVLDLTQPNGMFMARDFALRDNDTIYVTEAPFSQWGKVIAALTGTLGAVGSVSTASATLSGDF